MSKYFKNKISYNHVLLLSVIAAYFLFLLCFYYANKGTEKQLDKTIESYLISIESGISSEALSKIHEYIETENPSIIESTRIEGSEVFKYFNVDKSIFADNGLNLEDIFSDHYVIKLDRNDAYKTTLIDTINAMSGIADIFLIENDSQDNIANASSRNVISTASLIFLLILILSIIYIGLSLDFQRNQEKLKAILMKGATQKYLMGNYQKNGLFLSLKTWLGGLVLFFMSFYLFRFNTYSDLGIFDFKFLGIVCLVPLALIIFITSFVIYIKIMTLIRE